MADPNAPAPINPFDQFDPDKTVAKPADNSAPVSTDALQPVANDNDANPFSKFGDVGPTPVSTVGAFARGAEKAILPAAGSLEGVGVGAETGAFAGAAFGPIGGAVGGVLGGLAGGYFGAQAVQSAQNWAVKKLPDSWQDALGFGDRQARLDEQQHPVASFLGGLLPYVVTMSPKAVLGDLPENATALQRIMAHPVGARMFGGALMGGMEAGNEKLSDENLDWRKVAIATVFGTVFNRPNHVGEILTEMGARPARTVLGRPHPTLAQVADLKVFGPGITGPVFHGTQEQAPEAALTAQENARVEAAALGEPPEPDLHAIARQMEPETFQKYEDLLKRRDTLQSWQGEGMEQNAAQPHLDAINAEIRQLSPDIAAAYRRAADTVGTGTVEAEQFPSFAHMLAAHEAGPRPAAKPLDSRLDAMGAEASGLATEAYNGHENAKVPDEALPLHKALSTASGIGWDVEKAAESAKWATENGRPDIAQAIAERAERRASEPAGLPGVSSENPKYETIKANLQAIKEQDQKDAQRLRKIAGEPSVPSGGEAPPNVEGPIGTPGAGIPSPQRTIGAQRAFIADDTTRRLIAAGRPEEEARAAGQLIAARFVTRAGRFGGKLGTPEELYAREGAAIAGPSGRPLTPASVSSAGVAAGSDMTLPTSGPGSHLPPRQTTALAPPEGVFSKRTMVPSQDLASNNVDMGMPSGRRVYHTLNNIEDLERAASESKPDLDNFLKSSVDGIDGAEVYGSRAKERESIQSKFEYQGRQPNQVSDWLGGRIMVDNWQAMQDVIERIKQNGDVRIVDDFMNEPKGGGYRAVHVQIMGSNGLSAEVQIQPREMTAAGEEAHKIYSKWRRREVSAEELPQMEADQAASEKLYNDAWQAFKEHAGGRPETHAEPVQAALDASDKINSLSPAEQKRELPKFSPEAEQTPKGVDQPAGVFMFDPTQLNVDAQRFQFKSGGDEYGVTGALRNVTKWDPAKAQSIIVWEQNDGKLYVADGHQRAGLARRLTEKSNAKGIELPGVLYREKDGISADDIRAMAAVTNIANGSGSAIDGAKVLRARPDLMDGSLPLSAGKGKQAAALARLGDEPFRMVLNDVIPEHYGAVVGELIPNDPARQEAAVKAIARFEPKNSDEAAALTQRVAQAELAKSEAGAQSSMFGDLETPESTAGEEMKIVGRAVHDLKKDKALFARVLANAERIEQTGSSIEREAAQSVASDADIFAKTLTSDAYTAGPVRDELVKAARDLKDGKASIGETSTRIIAAIRKQIEENGADRAGAVEREPEAGEPSLELAQTSDANDLFEPGAEGKPQQLIPGVKPVSQRDLIQQAANKPLAPKKPQKEIGGLFGDSMDQKELFQTAQGGIKLNPNNVPGRDYLGVSDVNPIMRLMKRANASTMIHESGHQFLAELMRDAAHPDAPNDLKADAKTALDWLGAKSADELTTSHHEKFARGFEQYLREGVAPSRELAGVFAKFRDWLLQIYQSIKGLGTEISPEIRDVFDRMLEQEPQRTVIAPERPPGGPQLHEVHEGDALHAEPHEAAALADRAEAELNRYVTEPPPEVANEVAPAIQKVEAEQAARAGTEPGGENGVGAGPAGQVEPSSGGPEPESAGGGVGGGSGPERGGNSGAEAEGVTRPDPRSKLGANAGTALAPGPANLFGPHQSPFTDKAGNIRIRTLTNREDIAQAIRDSAAENNDFVGDRRGVITDGQVLELADALGMDAATLNRRQLGQAFNAEQIGAARKLLIQSATEVSAAMQKASIGTDEDVMAYALAKDRHQLIQAQIAGITAEAGRALRAFRDISGKGAEAKAIDQFIKEATGKTLFQLRAEARLGAQLKTPQQVSKYMQDSQKFNFGRIILEYWINGLISGPATHMTYMVGNTISGIMKLPEALASAAAGRAAEALGREGTRVRAGEVGALARGAVRGFAPALKAGIEAARTGVTTALPSESPAQATLALQPGAELAEHAHLDEAATFHDAMGAAFGLVRGMRDTVMSTAALVAAGGVKGESLIGTRYTPGRATPDITYRGVTVLPLGAAVTMPGRGVAVLHSFYRSLIFSMEKNAAAYRQAAEEGLDGTALHARVAELRSDPSQTAMDQMAAHEATESALMGRGSELTQRLAALTTVRIFGAPLLKFIDPFVRVSGNIIDQSLIRRTPVGLLTLMGPETELARDLTGKNGNIAQDKAIGRMMMGTALAVTFGSLAAQKMLSGSGPKDPKESNVWRMAGNQAHSVRIGDTWYSVNKLGPVGMLASLSADLFDVAHEAEGGEFTKAGAHLLHAITQNILDESAMHGPAELLKAIETPDRYGESYVRNYLAAFVPYSVGLAQMARAMDPYQRDTKTMIDTIRNKIPGHLDSYFGHELPVRRDIWGEPLPSRTALVGAAVSAIYEQGVNNDPVNQAMWKVGVFPASVDRKIRNVPLDADQYDDFQRLAGRMAKMRLDKMVISSQFQQQTPSVQHDWMTEAIRQSRTTATEIMLHKYPVIAAQALTMKSAKKQAINDRNPDE